MARASTHEWTTQLSVEPCEVRYRRQILDLEIDHEILRVSSRPFTAQPVTISYRGHFRDISPGQTYEFRLIKPRGERSPCRPARAASETKGRPS